MVTTKGVFVEAMALSAIVMLLKVYSPMQFLYQIWPEWAVNPFLVCSVICGGVFWAQSKLTSHHESKKGAKVDTGERPPEFVSFQRQWLRVYLLTMLADWLQGTHMYTLYTSYQQPAGTLFAIGFTSSALFGTFLGLFVDKYGRRLGCIVFCILELAINALEHVNDFNLLVLGRILGGLSTSLLFTAFESWMVSEHRKRGFEEDWIGETFALAQMGNGLMAVLAGVMAQVSADYCGDIGPFQLAIALTFLALLCVFTWPENYGGDHHEPGEKSPAGGGGDHLFREAMHCILNDRRILLLGLIQSLFEGAMYTFVIMWVPTLARIVPGSQAPPGEPDWARFAPGQGWVFSAMMVCITIGGEMFAGMLKLTSVEKGSVLVFLVAGLSMVAPAVSSRFEVVLSAILVLEVCVGAFFGSMATMRSHYLPDSLQASIMNIFRVPLNLFVMAGAALGDRWAPPAVWAVVSCWFLAAAALQLLLCRTAAAAPSKAAARAKAE